MEIEIKKTFAKKPVTINKKKVKKISMTYYEDIKQVSLNYYSDLGARNWIGSKHFKEFKTRQEK